MKYEVKVELHMNASDVATVIAKCQNEKNVIKTALKQAMKQYKTDMVRIISYEKMGVVK